MGNLAVQVQRLMPAAQDAKFRVEGQGFRVQGRSLWVLRFEASIYGYILAA